MEKNKIWANDETEVSRLGFGCMRFPEKDGGIDEEKALAMLNRAYDAGVTYFDTAWPYHGGKSEEFVGRRFVSTHDRSTFMLATKLPCWAVTSVEKAEEIFAKQLENLHTDYIDFYLLHALNKDSFSKMEKLGICQLLLKWKQEGKIRHIGFSFHDSYEVFESIVNYWDKWEFCQLQLNYMDMEDQAGMKGYRLAEEKGIPIVVMEPVKGGSLANIPDDVRKPFLELDPEASNASWALRYVASLPNVKVILSGMTQEDQLEDNLKTFAKKTALSEQEIQAVYRVRDELAARTKNGCTGCRYCMPCPMGVNIPENFRIWNTYYRYQNAGEARWQWNSMPEAAKGSACVQCGKCEEACPQKLNIREDLQTLCAQLNEVCK